MNAVLKPHVFRDVPSLGMASLRALTTLTKLRNLLPTELAGQKRASYRKPLWQLLHPGQKHRRKIPWRLRTRTPSIRARIGQAMPTRKYHSSSSAKTGALPFEPAGPGRHPVTRDRKTGIGNCGNPFPRTRCPADTFSSRRLYLVAKATAPTLEIAGRS